MFSADDESIGRPQQLQLCRQRVPCSRCGDRECPVADSSAARRDRQTTKHAVQIAPVSRCMTRYVAPTEPGVTKSNDPLIFDPRVVLFRNILTPGHSVSK